MEPTRISVFLKVYIKDMPLHTLIGCKFFVEF
ncbi:hypothetical protein T09_518 [Trichinella sp. T9]|nr:hypothetical protein T09_518 [Trichinella sp. T9]